MGIQKPLPQYPLTTSVWEDLRAFDRLGIGDRDGKIEFTDVDPYSLATKFRFFSEYWKKNGGPRPAYTLDDSKKSRLREGSHEEARRTAQLWNHFTSIRYKILEALQSQNRLPPDFEEEVRTLAQNPGRIVQEDILNTLTLLFEGQPPYDVAPFAEDFFNEKGVALGDSLSASMQFGAQSAPGSRQTPPYLLPAQVLKNLEFPPHKIQFLTPDGDFPINTDRHLDPGPWYISSTFKLLWRFLISRHFLGSQECALASDLSGEKADSCPQAAYPQVYLAAIPAATLQDVLIDLKHPGTWTSPGQLFLAPHRSRIRKTLHDDAGPKNLIGYAIDRFSRLGFGREDPKGGFFAVALGSNDLLSFRQIVVSAPQQNAAAYEQGLEQLDRQTEPLVAQGVRRIFFIPPNVAESVFAKLPAQTRFTDGRSVPLGSVSLYHWVIAARREEKIPRHVVLTPEEFQQLKDEYIRYREAIQRVLVERSNWLVLDNRWDLPAMANRIIHNGIRIAGIPGYGEIFYKGYEAAFSPDNVHPSNFGYLIWSELIAQATRNRHIRQDPNLQPLQYLAVDQEGDAVTQSVRDVEARVRQKIRANPSLYRPRRLPYNSIVVLKTNIEKLEKESPETIRKKLEPYWPYLSNTMLDKLLEGLSLPLDKNLPHHQKAAALKAALNHLPDAAFRKVWPELHPLLKDWAEAAATNFFDQIHFTQAYYSSIGARENYDRHDFERGSQPGVFDTRKTYQTLQAGYQYQHRDQASQASLRYALGLVSNTAYLAGNFSYFVPMVSAYLYRTLAEGEETRLDLEPQFFLNTPLRTPWKLQLELGGVVTFPDIVSDPENTLEEASFTPEAGLSLWPWNDPAFEKEGWALRLSLRHFHKSLRHFPKFDPEPLTGQAALQWSF